MKIKIDQIQLSKTNPRTHFDEESLKELAESIKEKGVQVPILVRELAGKIPYELVDGERRIKAAKIAALAEIEVIVKTLTDEDAAEVQMISFVRQDITAMEEAEMYDRLAKKGNDVKTIAKKTGRTPSRVAQTMVLLNLHDTWRRIYEEDHINRSMAMNVARLTPELQKELYTSINYQLIHGQPDPKELKERIEQCFHIDLDKAVFDKADAKLVPEAGSCTLCPFCSGNNLELFSDFGKKAICTNNRCFKQKVKANHAKNYSQLRKSGEKFVLITEDEYTRKSDVLTKSEWLLVKTNNNAGVKALIWNGENAGKIVIVKPLRIPKQTDKPLEKKQEPKEESWEVKTAKRQAQFAASELRFIEILKVLIPKLPDMKDTKALTEFVIEHTEVNWNLMLIALGEKEVFGSDQRYKLLTKHLSETQIIYYGIKGENINIGYDGHISKGLFELCDKRKVNYKAILQRISDEEKKANKTVTPEPEKKTKKGKK